ncbi:hypothetical protein L345_10948, partial [Ophiophagus hannah]
MKREVSKGGAELGGRRRLAVLRGPFLEVDLEVKAPEGQQGVDRSCHHLYFPLAALELLQHLLQLQRGLHSHPVGHQGHILCLHVSLRPGYEGRLSRGRFEDGQLDVGCLGKKQGGVGQAVGHHQDGQLRILLQERLRHAGDVVLEIFKVSDEEGDAGAEGPQVLRVAGLGVVPVPL